MKTILFRYYKFMGDYYFRGFRYAFKNLIK